MVRVAHPAVKAAVLSAQARIVGEFVPQGRPAANLKRQTKQPQSFNVPFTSTPFDTNARREPFADWADVRDQGAASEKDVFVFPVLEVSLPSTPFLAQLIAQDLGQKVAINDDEKTRQRFETSSTEKSHGRSLVLRNFKSGLGRAQRNHSASANAYRRTAEIATEYNIQRYHLVTDANGLFISDTKHVGFVVKITGRVGKWGAALELTKAHTKQGRNGGRTPWQILRDFSETVLDEYGELFRKFALAFKWARQLT